MLAVSLTLSSRADEPAESPGAKSGETVPAAETDVKFPPTDPEDSEARHRAKQLGVVMLGGIVIIGVALVAFVLIWGNRVRRTARAPLPRVADRNELWYLKPGRKEDAEGTPPESPPEEDK